ncbi:MAG: ankyrin repeat domain-containing protein [Alphaproteobacteria bacterium]
MAEINDITKEFISQNYATLTPERIREYHKKGADLNALWRDGSALLHKLCALSQDDIASLGLSGSLQALLECGADPNLKDAKGRTILDYLKKGGIEDQEEKKALLKKYAADILEAVYEKSPATPEAIATPQEETKKEEKKMIDTNKDPNSLTPEEATEKLKKLHWTSMNADMIRKYLDAGADINVKNDNGHTLLTTLLGQNVESEREFAKEMLARGADPNLKNEHGFDPLHYALATHSLENLKLLAENKGDFLSTPKEQFFKYLKGNQEALDFVEEIIKKQGQEKRESETEKDNVVELSEADYTITPQSEIQTQSRKPSEAEFAVEQFRKMKLYGKEGILLGLNDREQIKRLIEKGLDINADWNPKENLTLAHLAAVVGNKEAMQMLDEMGIDWNQIWLHNNLEFTTAHLAAQYNKNNEALKFLIGKVDFYAKDKDGKSALDYIQSPEKRAEIEELIRKSAENKVDNVVNPEEQKKQAEPSAPENNNHSVDPNDNGEQEEGEKNNNKTPDHPVKTNDDGEQDEGEKNNNKTPDHPVNTNDDGEQDEGEKKQSPTENQQENDTQDNKNEAPKNEAPKQEEKTEGRSISKALKNATDTFFANVFGANHKTAEDFAQAMLFNVLAFPLEALGNYLSQEEKKKLDKLAQKINENAKQQPLSEDEQRLKNIIKLQYLMMARDPEAFKELYAGKERITPEEVEGFLKNNPDLQKRMEKNLGEIAQDPEGRALIEALFPEGYNGRFSKEDLIGILTGRLGQQKQNENGKKTEGKEDNLNPHIDGSTNPPQKQAASPTGTPTPTPAPSASKTSSGPTPTPAAPKTSSGPTPDPAAPKAPKTSSGPTPTPAAPKTSSGPTPAPAAPKTSSGPTPDPVAPKAPDASSGKTPDPAAPKGKPKRTPGKKSASPTIGKGKGDEFIFVKGKDGIVHWKPAPPVPPVVPPKGKQAEEQKGNSPFTLPGNISQKSKDKIMGLYDQVKKAPNADKIKPIFEEFMRSKEGSFTQKANAWDLAQNHSEELNRLKDKLGRFNHSLMQKELNKLNEGKKKNELLDADTMKQAWGLKKRLEAASKAGAPHQKDPKGHDGL